MDKTHHTENKGTDIKNWGLASKVGENCMLKTIIFQDSYCVSLSSFLLGKWYLYYGMHLKYILQNLLGSTHRLDLLQMVPCIILKSPCLVVCDWSWSEDLCSNWLKKKAGISLNNWLVCDKYCRLWLSWCLKCLCAFMGVSWWMWNLLVNNSF